MRLLLSVELQDDFSGSADAALAGGLDPVLVDLTPELLDEAAEWLHAWVVGQDGTETENVSARGTRDALRTAARALRGESDE